MAADHRPAPRVLVVEDDLRTAVFLDRALTRHGYDVAVASDGEAALALATTHRPDLIVLDRMLPGLDGLEVARTLRTTGPAPILMLTARDAVDDRVVGLDAGADDYLAKPFALEELLARVRAQLRRQATADAHARRGVATYADLRVDQDIREARRGDRLLVLRPRAFDLLAYFVRHPERVIARSELVNKVWGYEHVGSSNLVDVTIVQLRRQVELGGEGRLIHTVARAGYYLAERADALQ
jgi:two-component system response regulator MprA